MSSKDLEAAIAIDGALCSLRAHLDLGEEREGRAEVGRALLDLRGVARLLPAELVAGEPRVRSHCRFRKRGTEYVSEAGMTWKRGRVKRQCDRALGGPQDRETLLLVLVVEYLAARAGPGYGPLLPGTAGAAASSAGHGAALYVVDVEVHVGRISLH